MNIVFEKLTKYLLENQYSFDWELEFRNRNCKVVDDLENTEHIAFKYQNKIFAFFNTQGEIDIPSIKLDSILLIKERKRTKYLVKNFNLGDNKIPYRIYPKNNNNEDITTNDFYKYLPEYVKILNLLKEG